MAVRTPHIGNRPPGALSFESLTRQVQQRQAQPELPPVIFLTMPDGIAIACRIFEPQAAVGHILILVHGGGASMDMGYALLASDIARHSSTAVILFDMRGHGLSGGPRGHLPRPDSGFADLDQLIAFARQRYPGTAIDLGGHSSGGGLMLNYLSRRGSPPASSGDRTIGQLLLLAPELGERSGIHHPDSRDRPGFASVRLWPFIINAVTGGRLCGGTMAVFLNYHGLPADIRPQAVTSYSVTRYSVNMALAVTPMRAAQQLASLPCPTRILIGNGDEMISASRLGRLVRSAGNPHLALTRLPDCGHLDILGSAAAAVCRDMGYPRHLTVASNHDDNVYQSQ